MNPTSAKCEQFKNQKFKNITHSSMTISVHAAKVQIHNCPYYDGSKLKIKITKWSE